MAKKARKAPKRSKRAVAKKAGKAKKSARARTSKRPAARRSPKPRASTKRASAKTTRVSAKAAAKPERGRRSTGAPAGAGDSRRVPSLDRERKRLRDVEETVPQPPSSLNLDRHASAARTGRAVLEHARHNHTETSPALTGGDVDADWEDAYAVGDEAPGGDNPTPDQDRVDDIGRALGIEYADNEELKASDKISARDKHRWELDPASAEDYPDHEE
jgi:hypothetical protein